MTENTPEGWVDDIEIENAVIKWGWSNFDGRDSLKGDGNYNFTVILDDNQARYLDSQGWTVKVNEPREEGDLPENTMKINISDRFGMPKVYFIKNGRKYKVEMRDLADIRRDTCLQLDVVASPSRWTKGAESGLSPYVKEMYVTIKQSRFGAKYEEYEEA